MFNLDNITNENNKKQNGKWPYISDHPCIILIIGGSGSGRMGALLSLTKDQDDIDKTYLYARDLSEAKYEFFYQKAGRRRNKTLKRFKSIY